MQSVCDNMTTACDKLAKIAKLLHTYTDIHINCLYSEASQNLVDYKTKSRDPTI